MKKLIKDTTIITLLFFCTSVAFAQRAPLFSSYFQNQYLFNVAQVGMNELKAIDATIRVPVGNNDEGLQENYFHFMYGFGRNGVGLGFKTSQFGVFNMIEGTASYALHLPLAEDKYLSLGAGLNFTKEQINLDKIIGHSNDPMIAYFNEAGQHLDINLGLTYSSKGLNINVATNNLLRDKNGFLLNQTPYLYGSVSYNVPIDDVELMPIIAYRQLLNGNDFFDFGTSVKFSNQFTTYLLYHTSKNFSVGMSTKLNKFHVSVGYNSSTAQIRRIGSQGLDVGARFIL